MENLIVIGLVKFLGVAIIILGVLVLAHKF